MLKLNVAQVKVLAVMQIVVHLFQLPSEQNVERNQSVRGVQCAMERQVNAPILNLVKIRPNVIMELSCASVASVLDRFVLVGIKPSASLPQRKCPTIRGDFVNLHAKMETIQIRVVQQVNSDKITDCQKGVLAFVLVHLVIISKVIFHTLLSIIYLIMTIIVCRLL